MNIDNLTDNGIDMNGKGFDDVMDNRNKSIESLAYEVFVILDGSIIDESDVGDTKFYQAYRDYMTNQGYDGDIIKKVWLKIEEEYLY